MSGKADLRSFSVRVGERLIGAECPCYVIAEAGSNHDGELGKARALVRAAAEAGADAVKFQSFTARGLVRGPEHPAFAALERMSLPEDWHAELAREAVRCGIHFLSTPFEEARIDVLERCDPVAYKVASGDLTHRRLLERLAGTGRPLLISTGLATEQEIAEALEWVKGHGAPPVILLHCVGLYPPPAESLNLRAIPEMRRRFGVPCGFSDHTLGTWASLGAVALGASVIEKHFTLDRSSKGPDHPHSLEPSELRRLVEEIRRLERGLGDGVKRPAPGEEPERLHARRGSYAARGLRRGDVLRAEDLVFLRPAQGLAPGQALSAVGRRLARDVGELVPLTASDLEPEGRK